MFCNRLGPRKFITALKTKTLYVIRHGQTVHNQKGIVQGRYVRSELSRLGHKQANAFYEGYKDVPFQKIYTSTLQRTVQTVQPFLKSGIPHEALPGLDEISWGNSEGKHEHGKDNKQYFDIIETWKSGNLEPRLPGGGENPLDVQQRQKEALNYIVAQPEDLVLVCMHGRALKILLTWVSGHSLKDMDNFDHDNLSLYILQYKHGKWHIVKNDERSHVHKLKKK